MKSRILAAVAIMVCAVCLVGAVRCSYRVLNKSAEREYLERSIAIIHQVYEEHPPSEVESAALVEVGRIDSHYKISVSEDPMAWVAFREPSRVGKQYSSPRIVIPEFVHLSVTEEELAVEIMYEMALAAQFAAGRDQDEQEARVVTGLFKAKAMQSAWFVEGIPQPAR